MLLKQMNVERFHRPQPIGMCELLVSPVGKDLGVG